MGGVGCRRNAGVDECECGVTARESLLTLANGQQRVSTFASVAAVVRQTDATIPHAP
jgi:hypothetical protein